MDVLPRGVTGFGPPHPGRTSVDFGVFMAAVDQVAKRLGIQVIRSSAGREGTQFHSAELDDGGLLTQVWCNCNLPLIAFVVDDWQSTTFLDHERLREGFAACPGFTVLGRAELERPVDEEALSELHPIERDQIRRWAPRAIHEIVFNHWD
jgi:hypothetical protein